MQGTLFGVDIIREDQLDEIIPPKNDEYKKRPGGMLTSWRKEKSGDELQIAAQPVEIPPVCQRQSSPITDGKTTRRSEGSATSRESRTCDVQSRVLAPSSDVATSLPHSQPPNADVSIQDSSDSRFDSEVPGGHDERSHDEGSSALVSESGTSETVQFPPTVPLHAMASPDITAPRPVQRPASGHGTSDSGLASR